MKFCGLSLLLVIIFSNSLSPQSDVISPQKTELNATVTDLKIEAKNLHLLLSEIAYKYSVPVSLEVATNDDLSKSKHLIVRLERGTLANVLDSIVNQAPSYTWEVCDDTIRVFPKKEVRDPVLQALLDTRVTHFAIAKRTPKYTFRQALTRLPELEPVLARHGVIPSNETFLGSDFTPFGRDFSMDLANVPVRSILNHVIKNSSTKYWIINRYGDNRQYWVVNF